MSRIGNRKLTIPEGVTVSFNDGIVTVKGAKGELTLSVSSLVKVVIEGNEITTEKVKDTKEANILSGTTNSNINNIVSVYQVIKLLYPLDIHIQLML